MFRQDTYGVILTGNTIPLPDGGILLEFRHIYLDTRHYLREEEFHKRFVPYALRE